MKIKDYLSRIFLVIVFAIAGFLWLSPGGLKTAPNIQLQTIDGKSIVLSDLRGQPLLINFWATSCPGCIKEMPHLIDLYTDLAPRGLEIIGIAMHYDQRHHVQNMIRNKEIPYPIILDSNAQASKAFGDIQLTPTSFLVAPNGRIVLHKIGEMDIENLRQQIHAMLQDS